MLVKAAPGTSNFNWFRGCFKLTNVTIENSLLNGNEPSECSEVCQLAWGVRGVPGDRWA